MISRTAASAFLVSLLASLLLLPAPADAALEELGVAYRPDDALGVTIDGPWAYVANGLSGLQVVDLEEPTLPRAAAFLDTPGNAQDVVVLGDLLLLSDGEAGLRVIDVGDPSRPEELRVLDTPGFAGRMFLQGDTLFVADGPGGLHTFDVSDPEFPEDLGFFPATGDVVDLWIIGTQGYLAVGDAGVQIVDLADPQVPLEVGLLGLENPVTQIAATGSTVYAGNGMGFSIIDVSKPEKPGELGFEVLQARRGSSGPIDMRVAESLLYVTHRDQFMASVKVTTFDIVAPLKPLMEADYLSFIGGDFLHTSLAIDDDVAVLTVGRSGLRVLQLEAKQEPLEIGALKSPTTATAVSVFGNFAYLSFIDPGSPHRIADVEDPQNPRVIGQFPGGDLATASVALEGSVAFFSEGNAISAVDVSDPSLPTLLDRFASPNSTVAVRRVLIVNERAYLLSGGLIQSGAGESYLDCVDISNPEALEGCGSLSLGTNVFATDMLIENGHAYVTGEWPGASVLDRVESLAIVDLENTKGLTEIARLDGIGSQVRIVGASRIAMAGHLVYTTNGLTIRVIDVADPMKPVEVERLNLFVRNIVLDQNRMFLLHPLAVDEDDFFSGTMSRLREFDLTNPLEPVLKHSIDIPPVFPGRGTPATATDMVLQGNKLYIADTEVGLRIFEVPEPGVVLSMLSAFATLAALRSSRSKSVSL